MKLIDKESLVAEIEKAIKIIYAGREYVGIPYGEECIVSGLQKAEDIINTLEVKEVDLEKESLTWEDIPTILTISEQLKTGWWFVDRTKDIGTQVFWEEVLKRFKAQKGEKA